MMPGILSVKTTEPPKNRGPKKRKKRFFHDLGTLMHPKPIFDMSKNQEYIETIEKTKGG